LRDRFSAPVVAITITAANASNPAMIQYFSAPPALSNKKDQSSEFAELTEREIEILNLIAQGHNNTVIAHKLSLSIKTVQNYVSSILTKLQVADRSQAIVRARDAGLGKKE
jgi:DNA-binding NarL/FixJ family response regulator